VRQQRRFAADASHELRSPLAAARAQLEVGLAYPDRTDWSTTAVNVLDELGRLERLAAELLELARLDAASDSGAEGAVPGVGPRREPVDLAELVAREASSPEWRDLPLRGPAAAAGAIPVLADPDLVIRVMRNLLANAARHARSRITLETGAGEDTAWVRVANDGQSIPLEHRDRIFEPFTRIDGARASRAGGAGLGLAISRRIARAHGGDLVLEAGDDGASFLLTLPLIDAPREETLGAAVRDLRP
jgi:signal transduction histidine kinase